MEKGEHWAFRRTARSNTWHEVKILTIGAKVKMRFEEDKFVGRQERVSAARLEAPWNEFTGYVKDEKRYLAMRDACNASQIESRAYPEVFAKYPLSSQKYQPLSTARRSSTTLTG